MWFYLEDDIEFTFTLNLTPQSLSDSKALVPWTKTVLAPSPDRHTLEILEILHTKSKNYTYKVDIRKGISI